MNETGHNLGHLAPRRGASAGLLWGAVAAVLIAASLWAFVGGCADPRSEPLAPASHAYTQTIVLWDSAVSSGTKLSAPFTVGQPLAPIRQLGVDHPARLTLAAYIVPDADIRRFEIITVDSLPLLTKSVNDTFQVNVFNLTFTLDSALFIDSSCTANPNCGFDTTGLDSLIDTTRAQLNYWTAKWLRAVADIERLTPEADSLARVLDDRFQLAIWMDDDTTTRYPEAAFDTLGRLRGQRIFAAATGDTTTPLPGMKGRGFSLNLENFSVADPVNPGRSLEVNWTQCFVGFESPCLSDSAGMGPHTLYARLTGPGSRITGTLVLVYREVTP
jgi:hypothetical protein